MVGIEYGWMDWMTILESLSNGLEFYLLDGRIFALESALLASPVQYC